MKKLEIRIDAKVYEESLKLFKSKENLENYISNSLIQYKKLKDIKENNDKLIKELKNVLEFIISNDWINKKDLILGNVYENSPLLVGNNQIELKYTNLVINEFGTSFYTFIPFLKEDNKEITTVIVEVSNNVISAVVVKNIKLLNINRTFKVAYNQFGLNECLDLEGTKYQLYLSLSYMFRVDFNEI